MFSLPNPSSLLKLLKLSCVSTIQVRWSHSLKKLLFYCSSALELIRLFQTFSRGSVSGWSGRRVEARLDRSLTCPASCAWPWTADTLGTATRPPVSHRAPASGRTGGRLCYTRRTGSACHPHLGECNLLVTLLQPCSTWEAEAAAVLEVRTKQEKDAKCPRTAGTLPSRIHRCSGNQQHLKTNKTMPSP